MKERGKFIVLEGVGGSGKTTQIKYLEGLLKRNGIDVVQTREPGGLPEAEEIRKLIFSLREQKLIGPEGQMVLFFAARKLWIKNVVSPSLDKGCVVITDRSHTSTGAYQGYAEGGDMDQILKISDLVMEGNKPDAVILLDISSKTAAKRKEDKEGDPFDKENTDYFEKLIEGYRKMAKEGWGGLKWYIVDGERKLNEVGGEIKKILEGILERRLIE